MRLVPVRVLVYVAIFALPGFAQQPTLMSDEMSHLEVSVGAGGIMAGPGRDLERRMIELGLQSRDGRRQYPVTSPPSVVPGVFAQVHVGAGRHGMVGAFLGSDQTTTDGMSLDGTTAHVQANVHTRALLLSYRPTPWIRIGAGPALLERRLSFGQGEEFHGDALGWLTAADAKFVRRPMTLDRPPLFGYVTGQYRFAPGLEVSDTRLPIANGRRGAIAWPAQHVRMSHWMIGIGVGFEI